MQNIDPYSYQCGVIDCFNEMVRSGVKALALSHPMDSAAERDALIPFARSCCHQYGNQLRKVALDTLKDLDIDNVRITIVDKGALDCTLKARIEGAVFRSVDQYENLPWGGAIR